MTIAPSPFGAPPNALAIAAARLKTGGKSTYYDDPAGFAQHCIQWPKDQGLAAYQGEIMTELAARHRAAVRGPHGLGKTTTNALVILWFATTRDQAGVEWKIATTAGAWRQLEKYLWPEVHKWAKRLRPDMIGRGRFSRTELLSLNLKLNHGQAFAVASDDPQLIEGVHADEVLYIFDESKAIPAGVFDAAEGAFSGDGASESQAAYALAVSTPGAPSGRFYEIHSRKKGLEDWWTKHVTLQDTIDAKRNSQKWADDRKEQWGEASSVYQNRVLGEFYSDDESGLVPLSWAEAAVTRWLEWKDAGFPELEGARTIGVDVARSGEDKTVLAPRDGRGLRELIRYSKQDTMVTTGIVKGKLDVDPLREAIVDVIGVGGGVVDRLREQKLNVIAFNASESTDKKDRTGELGFNNVRSAAWWNIRELLDPAYGANIMLPDEPKLLGDLCTPTWTVQSGGKIKVESKDEIKKRIGRSPDDGDAVVMAFWDGADHTAKAWTEWQRKRADAAAEAAADPIKVDTEDREALRQAAFRGAMRRG